jgi:aminopeptidase N
LSTFNLDLQGMDVASVTVDDHRAAWARDGGELTVTPRRPLWDDREFTTVVTYSGVPKTLQDALGGNGFFHTDDGAVAAGQPDGADTWFPSNDHPRDAASVDVTITVPEGLEALSNGVLRGQSTKDGWTTWRWHAAEPMATYLVTLAIGEYDVHAYEADGIRFWDAVDVGLSDPTADGSTPLGVRASASFARQPEILAFLSDFLGPYPFRAAGGIVDDTPELGFALETQTRPVYPAGAFGDPVSGDLFVVHELAHQWTGDLVRLARWRDIWLNEGFATYAEWLWGEHEGLATVQEQFDQFAALPADDPLWTLAPGDPGPAADQLFDNSVYNRGAMTLHALRLAVGDDTMHRIAREWTSDFAGKAVTTDDFIALAEHESGQQLDELFRTWLYTPGKPAVLG